MSVMLLQLSKAIMNICSALFIESLSMFSHETPDPSNQSSLSRASETCLYHNFFDLRSSVRQVKFKNKTGEKYINFKKAAVPV